MGKLFLDIETTKIIKGELPSTIWCVVTICDKGNTVYYTPDNLHQFKIDASNYSEFIGHNLIGFDAPVLKKVLGIDLFKLGKVTDTLILSRLFNPVREGGHSLKAFGEKFGYHKIDFDDFTKFSQEMLTYCIRDVKLLIQIYNLLMRQSKNFSEQSIELEHKVAEIIEQQVSYGFTLDQEKAHILLARLQAKIDDTQTKVRETFLPLKIEETFIPKSNNKSRGYKGHVIVDEKVLSEITDIPEAELINEFLLLQKRVAMIESWIEAVREDGRVHGQVITNGAITGRMSHKSPNMAQIPAVYSPYGTDCRELWVVPNGYKLVGVDASGLELRILSHYMNDADYINEVINGDIHTTNQTLAGLETRDIAKKFIYAFIYGAGNKKLGLICGKPESYGKEIKDRFLKKLPSLARLRERVEVATKKGYLKGLDKRKLIIRRKHSALNTLIQGGGAIAMKKALVLLEEYIKQNSLTAIPVANVHDEFQYQVQEEQADVFGTLAVKSIVDAGDQLGLRCSLNGEYKIGNNWKETH